MSPAGLLLALLTGVTLESCGGDGGAVHAAETGGGRGGAAGAETAGEADAGIPAGRAGDGGAAGNGGAAGSTTIDEAGHGGEAGGEGGNGTGASAGSVGQGGQAEAGVAGRDAGAAGEGGSPSSGGSSGETGTGGEGGARSPATGHCPRLESPENGSVDDKGATVGVTADYSCERGYRLEQSASQVCRANGTWRLAGNDAPYCDRFKCNPITTAGVAVTYDPPDRGCDAQATFRCNAGTLSDDEPRVCTCETGVWMPAQAPTCQ